MPFKSQSKQKRQTTHFVVGIDEVGRGPLAGPVAVCALVMTHNQYRTFMKSPGCRGLRDSKKLSPIARERWFQKIKQWRASGLLDFSYKTVSARTIDRVGISAALQQCVKRSLQDLDVPFTSSILLDGSLHAPMQFIDQKTIIKGDENIPIISLSSIVAKVTRDKYMNAVSHQYPQYHFDVHKGYGTAAHRVAIRTYGLSSIHRRSFCKNI